MKQQLTAEQMEALERFAKQYGRATQKTLDQQHSTAFNPDYLTLLKAEVIAFYYDKRKKDAA